MQRLDLLGGPGTHDIEIHRQLFPDGGEDFPHKPEDRVRIRRMGEAAHKEEALPFREVFVDMIQEGVVNVGRDGLGRDRVVLGVYRVDLHLGRIIGHIHLVHQGEFHGLPVLRLLPVLHIPGQLILPEQPQEVEVVAVENHLQTRMLFNIVHIFGGDMGPVQVNCGDFLPVPVNPVPDAGLILGAVDDLDAHLLQGGGVGFLMEEIVPQELDHVPLVQEHLQILEGRLGARIPVPGGHVVVHHQENLLSHAPLSRAEGIRIARIIALLREFVAPLLAELFAVLHLVALEPRPRDIGAVGDALEVNHLRQRLVNHPVSVAADLKGQVRVLAVGRRIAVIKPADLLPQASADENRGAGDIVHILDVVVFCLVRIIQAAVVPAGSVAPDDAAGFLQAPVGIDQLGAAHAHGAVLFHHLHQGRKPALGHLRVIVQEHDVGSLRRLCRIVAVPEEPLVCAVSADHQVLGKFCQMLRRILRHVIGDDHLIADILRVLQNGHQAEIGIMDLVVAGDHNGDRRMLLLRKMQLSVGPVIIPDLKISLNQVFALIRAVHPGVLHGMEQRILGIGDLLPLCRSLRIGPVEGLAQLPPHLEDGRFMPVEIGQRLCHFPVFPSEIRDHHVQVGHMVVGQPVGLPLLPKLQILSAQKLLHLGKPLLCPQKLPVHGGQILHALRTDHVVFLVGALVFPVHILLEAALHLLVDGKNGRILGHIFREMPEKLFFCHIPENARKAAVSIHKGAPADESRRHREEEYPLIIQAADALRSQDKVLQKAVDIGHRVGGIRKESHVFLRKLPGCAEDPAEFFPCAKDNRRLLAASVEKPHGLPDLFDKPFLPLLLRAGHHPAGDLLCQCLSRKIGEFHPHLILGHRRIGKRKARILRAKPSVLLRKRSNMVPSLRTESCLHSLLLSVLQDNFCLYLKPFPAGPVILHIQNLCHVCAPFCQHNASKPRCLHLWGGIYHKVGICKFRKLSVGHSLLQALAHIGQLILRRIIEGRHSRKIALLRKISVGIDDGRGPVIRHRIVKPAARKKLFQLLSGHGSLRPGRPRKKLHAVPVLHRKKKNSAGGKSRSCLPDLLFCRDIRLQGPDHGDAVKPLFLRNLLRRNHKKVLCTLIPGPDHLSGPGVFLRHRNLPAFSEQKPGQGAEIRAQLQHLPGGGKGKPFQHIFPEGRQCIEVLQLLVFLKNPLRIPVIPRKQRQNLTVYVSHHTNPYFAGGGVSSAFTVDSIS